MLVALCERCGKILPASKPMRQTQGQPPPSREEQNLFCSEDCERLYEDEKKK